jgi:tetratricopeptide (TPR) repeat protein
MRIIFTIFFLGLLSAYQAQTLQNLIDQGEFLQAYEEGISKAKTSDLALASRAAIFYADYQASTEEKASWYDKAEKAAQQALALDSNNALAYLYLAQAQGRLGQYQGILQSLNLADAIKKNAEKAITLDPNLNEATITLAIWHSELASRGVGWLYGASEEKALELLASIAEQEADTFLFHLEYGNILAKFQKNEEAIRQYQTVLALTPQVATDFAMLEQARQTLEMLERN